MNAHLSSNTRRDNEEEYIYDAEHSRVELYDYQDESANVLYYLNDPTSGAMSEISWVDYTWHDYLKVDGKLIAERFCPVGTTCSSTTAWHYFVTDSLGSVATVTDSTASPDAAHTTIHRRPQTERAGQRSRSNFIPGAGWQWI